MIKCKTKQRPWHLYLLIFTWEVISHYSVATLLKKNSTFKKKRGGGIIWLAVFPSPLSNDTEDKSSKSDVNENMRQILYVVE